MWIWVERVSELPAQSGIGCSFRRCGVKRMSFAPHAGWWSTSEPTLWRLPAQSSVWAYDSKASLTAFTRAASSPYLQQDFPLTFSCAHRLKKTEVFPRWK
jgi:hypothetical protein